MGAGVATLRELQKRGEVGYQRLEIASIYLEDGLRRAAENAEVSVRMARVGSMLTMFFTASGIRDYAGAKASDTAQYAEYFRGMLTRGVFLAPSQFEAMFVSMVHTDAEIENTIAASEESLREVR
jgi:glutamate-1-semialdehyde 2,1-aminomutase